MAQSPVAPAATEKNQEPLPDSQSELIRQLLKRVAGLEAQIKELKEPKAVIPAPPSTPDSASQTVSGTPKNNSREQNKPTEETESEANNNSSFTDKITNGLPGFQLRGFSNIDWQMNPNNAKSRILLGNVDLLISSRLSEKLSVLGELNIEAESNGEFIIDPERLLLQYDHSNYLTVAAGKYHSAIGYYNTVYHHGKWFETAATRPRIMEFEDKGGILPIHNLGVSVSGQIPSGKLGLNYIAQLGNGGAPHYVRQDTGLAPLSVEPRKGKSYLLGLNARPAGINGLQIGSSIYRDSYEQEGTARIQGTILNSHVVFQRPGFEFLNEFFWLRHSEATKKLNWDSIAAYSQISHRINKYRPFIRYQYMNINKNDPFWGDVGRIHGPSVGVRYELSDFAALKLEFERLNKLNHAATNGITLQLSFTF